MYNLEWNLSGKILYEEAVLINSSINEKSSQKLVLKIFMAEMGGKQKRERKKSLFSKAGTGFFLIIEV